MVSREYTKKEAIRIVTSASKDYKRVLEDIRDLSEKPSQVLAVMSKKSDDPVYKDIRYVAKGLPLDKLEVPEDLAGIIDRSGFRKK